MKWRQWPWRQFYFLVEICKKSESVQHYYLPVSLKWCFSSSFKPNIAMKLRSAWSIEKLGARCLCLSSQQLVTVNSESEDHVKEIHCSPDAPCQNHLLLYSLLNDNTSKRIPITQWEIHVEFLVPGFRLPWPYCCRHLGSGWYTSVCLCFFLCLTNNYLIIFKYLKSLSPIDCTLEMLFLSLSALISWFSSNCYGYSMVIAS